MPNKIAILMTCYNRVKTTLSCLEHLYKATIPDNISFDIYLVDDKSPDETGKIVKQKYPEINVITGTGFLYWNRGMRLAWDTAAKHFNYDFYVWLNDDTLLETDAFTILFSDYENVLTNRKTEAIITGACYKKEVLETTYGGRDRNYLIIQPNGNPQECVYINGNFTLVPRKIFDVTGNLSKTYTHSLGDHDYGLRALKVGFKCYVTSKFIASCNKDRPGAQLKNPELSKFEKLKLLYSKKWICFPEYFLYIFRHQGLYESLKTTIGSHLFLLKRK